MNNLLIKLS